MLTRPYIANTACIVSIAGGNPSNGLPAPHCNPNHALWIDPHKVPPHDPTCNDGRRQPFFRLMARQENWPHSGKSAHHAVLHSPAETTISCTRSTVPRRPLFIGIRTRSDHGAILPVTGERCWRRRKRLHKTHTRPPTPREFQYRYYVR